MTGPSPTPSDFDETLAAEYVLGAQDLAERLAIEGRIKTDPAFAALVAQWETRLGGLNDDFVEVPAPNLLPAIEARLFPKAARQRGGLFGWLSGAAAAVAVVLVGLAILAPPGNTLVAVLATSDNRLAYEVRHFGDEIQVVRVAGTPAVPGRVHELWLIKPGSAPVSLGLLDEARLVVAYPRPPAGWTLAVSIEPAGGSPIGSPTGPVILTAEIPGDA